MPIKRNAQAVFEQNNLISEKRFWFIYRVHVRTNPSGRYSFETIPYEKTAPLDPYEFEIKIFSDGSSELNVYPAYEERLTRFTKEQVQFVYDLYRSEIDHKDTSLRFLTERELRLYDACDDETKKI